MRDYNIAAQLRQRLDLPATVVNDVSAAALGEAVHGPHPATHRIAHINFGTGVGVALVHQQRLQTGAHGTLGLVSALSLPPEGRTIQQLTGGKALVSHLDDDISDHTRTARREAVQAAALLIGFTAGLCDPHIITVAGGLWLHNVWFRNQVLAHLHETLHHQTTGLAVPHVATATLGDSAGLLRAAHLAFTSDRGDQPRGS